MPVLRSRFWWDAVLPARWEMAPTIAPWLADSGNGQSLSLRESSFCAFPSVRIQTRNRGRQVSGKRDSCRPMLFYIRFLSIRPLSPVDRKCQEYYDSCVREWRKENARWTWNNVPESWPASQCMPYWTIHSPVPTGRQRGLLPAENLPCRTNRHAADRS